MSAGVRGSNAYLLFVLTVTYAVNWADRQVVPILFPGIRADLGLTDTELGVIGGLAFSLIYAVTGFFFGIAADRYMRIYVIAFGLTLWSLATAAGGLATDFTTLFWARFFTGVGEASLFPCAISLIGERFPPDRRGRALGTFGISSALGAGIGIGLGGRLAETLGWRYVFIIYGLAGLLLLPLVLSVPEARRKPSAEGHEVPMKVWRELLSDTPLLLMWLAGCLAIGSALGYAAWLPSFFIRNHGLDVTTTGTIFGVGSLIGGIGGSLLGGFLADRRGRARFAGQFDVSVASALVAIPLILLTINNWTPPVYLTAGVVALIAIYAFFPPLQAVMVSLVPKERHGIASSMNVFFLGGLGSALGPFVVGLVSDRTGSLHTALNVPVIGFLIAAILAGMAGRMARRTRSAPLAPEPRV